jgi:hypothetical protein
VLTVVTVWLLAVRVGLTFTIIAVGLFTVWVGLAFMPFWVVRMQAPGPVWQMLLFFLAHVPVRHAQQHLLVLWRTPMRRPVLVLLSHAPALRVVGGILRAAVLMQIMHGPVLLPLLSEPAPLLLIIKGHEVPAVVLLFRGIACTCSPSTYQHSLQHAGPIAYLCLQLKTLAASTGMPMGSFTRLPQYLQASAARVHASWVHAE